jgi:hypothetical protein
VLNSRSCVDALRLSEEEQQFILGELDRVIRAPTGRDLRQNPRYRYVVREGVHIEVEGSSSRFIVRPRNLSAGGISFLHGTFLYPGAACVTSVKTLNGEPAHLAGRIVRCRCVHGRIHEIGVQFQERVDVGRFIVLASARVKQPEAGHEIYEPGEVVRLALEIQDLALRQVPRQQLFRKIAELVELLRDPAKPAAAPAPAARG